MADQATQAVFVLLARQAVRLKGEASLVPWLFDSAHDICRLMRSDLEATVTAHLGRKVVAFMSDNHVEPDMGVEVFVLEPETASRLVPTGGP